MGQPTIVRNELICVPRLCANNKYEVIRELVNALFKKTPNPQNGLTPETVYSAIIDREQKQSTGMEAGLAFPHARIDGWGEVSVVFGVSEQGVDFDSVDKKPAHFIFLVISSSEEPYIVLQTMADIIKFIQEKPFSVAAKEDPEKMARKVGRYLFHHDSVICASDIMRPLKTFIHVDSSVEDVIQIMHLQHLDVLPVLDDDKQLYGQISCFDVFEHGIPGFFENLTSVSFVRKIDPFEKYFRIKKDLKARDFVSKECVVISENETLMEIVFLLTVKKVPRLFVAREGRLIGVVDRFSILDKILFF